MGLEKVRDGREPWGLPGWLGGSAHLRPALWLLHFCRVAFLPVPERQVILPGVECSLYVHCNVYRQMHGEKLMMYS